MSQTKALSFIAAISLLSGAIYFFLFPRNLFPDSPSYVAPARNLLAGNGYTGSHFEVAGVAVDEDGVPETFRTPGYPLFLALFFSLHCGLKSVIVAQHLLRVALIVATARFVLRIGYNLKTALIAGIAMAIDLPFLEAANSVLSDLLFAAVLLWVLQVLWTISKRKGPAAASLFFAGTLAGVSVLIRPIGILFFLPAAVFLVLTQRSQRTMKAVVFLVGFAILPALWAARNHHVIGHFTVSTITGFSELQYKAAGAVAAELPGKFDSNLIAVQKQLEHQACEISHDCALAFPAGKSEAYAFLARRVIVHHPRGLIQSTFRGAVVMMLDGGAYTMDTLFRINGPTAFRLLLFYSAPCFLFSLYGLKKLFSVDRAGFILALSVVLYFVFISAGPESDARFRVPIIPVYGILIALGVEAFISRYKQTGSDKQRLQREFQKSRT